MEKGRDPQSRPEYSDDATNLGVSGANELVWEPLEGVRDETAGRLLASVSYEYALTDQLMNSSIPDTRLQELFSEQEEGYAKSRLLAEGKNDGVDVIEEVKLAGLPVIPIVSISSLERVYGKDAVAKALAGGKKILTCSDDRVTVPEGYVKVGFPGLCALVQAGDRPAFFQRVRSFPDVEEVCRHHPCGACDGNDDVSASVGNEVASALGKPLKTSGYGEKDDYRMTGESAFHEGLGFVISEQTEFNSAALGMEKHMLLSAACAVSDQDLNHQAKALVGILMDHGWGPEFFRKNKLTIKLVGIAGDPKRNATSLARRLQPTFAYLQQYFPGTVSVVAFDAPHRPKSAA